MSYGDSMKPFFAIFFMFLVINTNAFCQGDNLLNVSFEYNQKGKVLTVYLENRSQVDIVLSRYTEVNENGSSLRVKNNSDAKSFSAIPLMLYENDKPSQRLLIKAGSKRYCKFPAFASKEYQGRQELYFTLHLVYATLTSQPMSKTVDVRFIIDAEKGAITQL